MQQLARNPRPSGPPAGVNEGQLVLDRFRIESLIGQGERASVYRATALATNEPVAFKAFHSKCLPSAWHLYEEAARRAATLDYSSTGSLRTYGCIAPVEFGFEPSSKQRFAVSQFSPFPSLEARGRDGPLSLQSAALLVQGLSVVLGIAHDASLVHRNLKPTNVFFDPEGGLLIGDFGTSFLERSTPVRPGWAMTPGWAPLEATRPGEASQPSMDVYCVALLAFYTLTGRSLFQSPPGDLESLSREHQNPPYRTSLRAVELGVPSFPELDGWFRDSLAVSPSHRFPNVREQFKAFSQALGAALSTSSQPAPSIGSVRESRVSQIPPRGFDRPERPVVLVSRTPLAFLPSWAPPIASSMPPGATPEENLPQREPSIPLHEPTATHSDTLSSGYQGSVRPESGIARAPIWLNRPSVWLVALLGTALGAWLTSVTLPLLNSGTAASEPAAEPLEESGLVAFVCEPSGCDAVYCDGVLHQVLPRPVALSPGPHTCKAVKKGYRTEAQTFTVDGGRSQTRRFVQTPRD